MESIQKDSFILLSIYVPQVIVSFIFTGVYDNPNTDVSGMSRAELHASGNLMLCHSPLQSQLFKSSISLFAIFHSTIPQWCYQLTCVMQFCNSFSVLCYWFLLSFKPWGSWLGCTKQQNSGSLTSTCNNSWGMESFISPCMSHHILFSSISCSLSVCTNTDHLDIFPGLPALWLTTSLFYSTLCQQQTVH